VANGATGHLASGSAEALDALQRLITGLVRARKHVYVVLSGPTDVDFDPRKMIQRTVISPGFKVVVHTPDKRKATSAVELINARIKEVAVLSGADFIDPVGTLCNRASCPSIWGNGKPIYQDRETLTSEYVRDNVRVLDSTLLGSDAE
jgi:hypothetical protein